ncbi:MAG: TniQ family protein [Proteobacteria bacterium]|nr:TniQ family protein [Pseudomonadota bacterium]
MRLPLRTRPQDTGSSTARSCWPQFCPTCLREDAVPFFRRSWTLATRVSCLHHGCRLRDRCPSFGQGLAPFRRDRLVPQQYCTFCDAPLAKPTCPTCQRRRNPQCAGQGAHGSA